MTRAVEPGRDTPRPHHSVSPSASPHGAVAEHDLSATGRGQLPPAAIARRARCRLDRGG